MSCADRSQIVGRIPGDEAVEKEEGDKKRKMTKYARERSVLW